MNKYLLIMSDTHRNEKVVDKVLKKHPKMHYYIHAGDSQMKEEWLKKRFTYYVQGNCDWGHSFQKEIIFQVLDTRILLIHGHEHLLFFTWNNQTIQKSLSKYLKEYNVSMIIFGHTHKRYFKSFRNPYNGILLNPGSLIFPRDGRLGSYLILNIHENNYIQHKYYEWKKN